MTDKDTARRKLLRRAAVVCLPLLTLAFIAFAVYPRVKAETAADDEDVMLLFNHRAHLAGGVQCLFCHPGATNGRVAGIPSARKCIGCHENIDVRSEEGQEIVAELLAAWEEGRPLVWEKMLDIPDFTYFNHRPHMAAGKNCEQCHGDVSQMAVAVPVYRINMGFCLKQCHRHQDPEQREWLMSCATCHQ
jgi:hypothetical protein